MMRMNGAFILSQLWLIIAVRSTDDYDERDLAIIPEVDFLSVSQETSSTSFPLNNLTQRPHQQHDENHSLEERNHRFQAYQERKVDKESDDIEDSVTEPLARFSVVTLVQMDVNNDTRLISPANSSNLQNIAFPVLPNNEENGKRMLSNNTEASEQDKNDNKKDEEDNGLNSNAIDEELEIRRKMKRTTIEVRSYPPVTETSSSPATTNIPSLDLDHTTALPATAISLPSTPDYSSISHDLDFGPRTTVSYASLSSTLPSNVAQDHYNRFSEVIKRVNVTELSTVPSFINVAVPFALPIPLGKAETPINLFDTQLQNSGFGALINNGHFWTADRLDAARKNDALQLQEKIQGQMQLHAPVDDVLGCTWDIVTSSCKDLFSLKLCSHCHDFGNIFLHNCKCLVKY